MKTAKEIALETLGLRDGATPDDIRTNYKKLALKWHPDKNQGNQEATKKFQDVSAAYKKLTSESDSDMQDDQIMTWAEMMQLFRQMFTCRGHHHYFDDYDDICDEEYTDDDEDDDDGYYFTEDTEDDDDDEVLDNIANRLRSKFEAKRYVGKGSPCVQRRPITEEEALKNARELIEQEETEKQKEERKRAKRKKKKEKRRQREKEKKIREEKEKLKQEEVIHKQQKSTTQLESTAGLNVKKGNMMNGPLNVHTEKKIVHDEKPSQIQEKTILQKHINTHSTVANGHVSNKKESHKKKLNNDPGSSDDDQIDTNSAFFAKAASKAPTVAPTQPSTTQLSHTKDDVESNKNNKEDTINSHKEKLINKNKNKDEKVDQKSVKMDPIVYKSREYAVDGNKLALKGDYNGAVDMFTQAIQLDPSDFRFFGNRSYCYDRLGKFERALKDANEAVSLAPEWAKGYFRKGRALTGIKRYEEAEIAFQDVLKLDASCEDAQFELARVRVQILIDMGFDRKYSEEAIRLHGTVQAACDALISGKVVIGLADDEVYFSDEDKKGSKALLSSKPVTNTSTHTLKPTISSINQSNRASTYNGTISDSSSSSTGGSKKPPIINNTADQSQIPSRCTSLWVGNVEPQFATEKNLTELFSQIGRVASVRILPAKYCAFVNYYAADDAANALEKLQGVKFCGPKLLLRYPDNQPPPLPVLRTNQPSATSTQKTSIQSQTNLATSTSVYSAKSVQKPLPDSKVTGPVNGDECYFWRTTGCVFNDRCRYKHVPEHRGLDLGKVKAKYGKGM